MHDPILNLPLGPFDLVWWTVPHFEIKITGWKLVGYIGMILFTGRWFVQMWASRLKGRPVIPRAFWYISMCGSLMLLSYWIWGKNDSVGILSNLFPACVALYNIGLDMKHHRALAKVGS